MSRSLRSHQNGDSHKPNRNLRNRSSRSDSGDSDDASSEEEMRSPIVDTLQRPVRQRKQVSHSYPSEMEQRKRRRKASSGDDDSPSSESENDDGEFHDEDPESPADKKIILHSRELQSLDAHDVLQTLVVNGSSSRAMRSNNLPPKYQTDFVTYEDDSDEASYHKKPRTSSKKKGSRRSRRLHNEPAQLSPPPESREKSADEGAEQPKSNDDLPLSPSIPVEKSKSRPKRKINDDDDDDDEVEVIDKHLNENGHLDKPPEAIIDELPVQQHTPGETDKKSSASSYSGSSAYEDDEDEGDYDDEESMSDMINMSSRIRTRGRARRERDDDDDDGFPRYKLRDRSKVSRRKMMNIESTSSMTYDNPHGSSFYPSKSSSSSSRRKKQRHDRPLRQHYDSSSDDSSNSSAASSIFSYLGNRNADDDDHGATQAGLLGAAFSSSPRQTADDKDFMKYDKKKWKEALDAVVPVQGMSATRELIKADAAPVFVDTSVTFDSIGGLDHHIMSLKEMVVFPLLYPEIFKQFAIKPPRGVLFVGPPGTGKTLTARALANSCKIGDRHVSFFMRKGADCLSKWVGEAERQLRLLFEQAKRYQPSIIFFDEIDGLAPVRSSKQDQIHASIVATLLALLDGLDDRGQVIVIGATNRPDHIDPALRRPGRFDREFMFSLPDQVSRCDIIAIHTRQWKPELSNQVKSHIASRTSGFCGADIQLLCSEAALHAVRRSYPSIYSSSTKLAIDASQVIVEWTDFAAALRKVVPASSRVDGNFGSGFGALIVGGNIFVKPLEEFVEGSLLTRQMDAMSSLLADAFPLYSRMRVSQASKLCHNETPEACIDKFVKAKPNQEGDEAAYEQRMFRDAVEVTGLSLYHDSMCGTNSIIWNPQYLSACSVCWFCIHGQYGNGQEKLIGSMLHALQSCHICSLDLPSLVGAAVTGDATPEQVLVRRFQEALRCGPSVIVIAKLDVWWQGASEVLRSTLICMMSLIPKNSCALLIVTTLCCVLEAQDDDSDDWKQLMSLVHDGTVFELSAPKKSQRSKLFEHLVEETVNSMPDQMRHVQSYVSSSLDRRQCRTGANDTVVLIDEQKGPSIEPCDIRKYLTEPETHVLRELAIFLRMALNEIQKDKLFSVFLKPVDPNEVNDYYDVIKDPIDIETMRMRVDNGDYWTFRGFMQDIDKLVENAKEYNPRTLADNKGKGILHSAYAARDIILSMSHRFRKKIGYDIFDKCDQVAKRALILLNGQQLPITPSIKYYEQLVFKGSKYDVANRPQSSSSSSSEMASIVDLEDPTKLNQAMEDGFKSSSGYVDSAVVEKKTEEEPVSVVKHDLAVEVDLELLASKRHDSSDCFERLNLVLASNNDDKDKSGLIDQLVQSTEGFGYDLLVSHLSVIVSNIHDNLWSGEPANSMEVISKSFT